MRRSILLFVLLLITGSSFAQVEVTSFYFNNNGVEPTKYTKAKLAYLQEIMNSNDFQVIEINSFSDISGSAEDQTALCLKRQEYVVNALKVSDENVIKNVFGRRRVDLNFVPYNWHRVDVYYHLGEELEIEEQVVADNSTVYSETADIEEETVLQDKPVILPIKFKEGTFKIENDSEQYLENLYQMLVDNPNLTAHIRGHVCCNNSRSKSKRRAKVVFKYLKKKGIDKKRLSFEGYSNWEPLVYPEATKADRAANRRVDIIFTESSPQ
ncbi:MAG: OmpA family protein [Crocinitomicaceae bacterium]|nr:OmpA family protein [Crocinitomicaceae bacterium]